MEWLYNVEGEGDNGYQDFYKDVDTVVMGKGTHNWLTNQGLSRFPYEGKKRYVFTRHALKHKNVQFIDENLTTFIEKIKQNDGGKIWIVGGGKIIHSFLKENLIDEIIVTVAAKLIGNGIPLFRDGEYSIA